MRRIFLTGASSGIGSEIARHLGGEGHALALSARREDRLRVVADELRAAPGVTPAPRPLVLPCDVADSAALAAAIARADSEIGPLDTLIYSAGSARFGLVEDTLEEDWSGMMASNLTGLFHAVRAVLPWFKGRKQGHILAILSISSKIAFPNCAAYTAAKFGALGFLDSLRSEVRNSGIHVTAILPGATDTPIWDAIGGSFDRGRMMQSEQVARVVASALRETTSGMIEEIRVGPVGGAL